MNKGISMELIELMKEYEAKVRALQKDPEKYGWVEQETE